MIFGNIYILRLNRDQLWEIQLSSFCLGIEPATSAPQTNALELQKLLPWAWVWVQWYIQVVMLVKYIEDITRWLEDWYKIYGFYLRVVKTIFYDERSKWVKYCFHHKKLKFISSSHLVFLFYYIVDSMQKAVNDVIDIFSSEDMENMSLVVF